MQILGALLVLGGVALAHDRARRRPGLPDFEELAQLGDAVGPQLLALAARDRVHDVLDDGRQLERD